MTSFISLFAHSKEGKNGVFLGGLEGVGFWWKTLCSAGQISLAGSPATAHPTSLRSATFPPGEGFLYAGRGKILSRRGYVGINIYFLIYSYIQQINAS